MSYAIIKKAYVSPVTNLKANSQLSHLIPVGSFDVIYRYYSNTEQW